MIIHITIIGMYDGFNRSPPQEVMLYLFLYLFNLEDIDSIHIGAAETITR